MKTIAVIGASSGFGKGIADELVGLGHRVTYLSRSLGLDVKSTVSVNSRLGDEEWDAVIYSAGIARDLRTIEDGNTMDWQDVFDVNAIGLMRVLRAVTPALRRTKGQVIALGSIASQLAYEGGADYCASKAAERTIMQTYRAEIAGSGIRSTLIEPGLGATKFQENRYGGDLEKAAKHYGDIKQLDPSDIADAVVWLLGLPWHVNVDEMIIKPTEQVTHGKLRKINRE